MTNKEQCACLQMNYFCAYCVVVMPDTAFLRLTSNSDDVTILMAAICYKIAHDY
jgi:hypothetical protein